MPTKKAIDGIFAEKILDLGNIALYRAFATNETKVGIGGGMIGSHTSIDELWYCKRSNEDTASVVSWIFNG